MFDRSSLYKEKIVCTYNDIIQIPDYTICQTIKSNKSNFDFYIDTDKLDKYNDDTLFRLVLARTEKDIFQCLRKSSVKYLPEFQKGIYNVINNLYEVAPILNLSFYLLY
jgi:ABC-type transporter lipoprotein component MlaA